MTFDQHLTRMHGLADRRAREFGTMTIDVGPYVRGAFGVFRWRLRLATVLMQVAGWLAGFNVFREGQR